MSSTILEIIHGPVFHLNQRFGDETIYWAQLNEFHLKTEAESSRRNFVF
jgi:hypothetical protein